MPIHIKTEDGGSRKVENAEYIPAFFFIPEHLLKKVDKEIYNLPRNSRMLVVDPKAREILESDYFYMIIRNVYAYMAYCFFPYDGEFMEIYSGYDPAWILAHVPDIWIRSLTDLGYLPTIEDMYSYYDLEIQGFASKDAVIDIMANAVAYAFDKWNLLPILETAKEFRCFEDFDYRDSTQKMDFYRKWYHTRTKHPQISLEEYVEGTPDIYDGYDMERDIADPGIPFEDYVVTKVDTETFMSRLSEKDRRILQLRLAGKTYEEIAAEVGYKTHSAVLKRIKKIGAEYQKFSGEDLGFK